MDTKRRVNWRILILALCTIVLFSGLTVRLWWLQTVEAAKLMDYAKIQWDDMEKTLQPKRGEILDRNGEKLAFEAKAYTVNARLKPMDDKDQDYVKDPYYTATKLAPILNAPVDKLYKYLTNPTAKVVELGRWGNKITEEQRNRILELQHPTLPNGQKVEDNQLPGITLIETTRRYYPNGSFATHVLGYVDYEGTPRMGIELQLDKELRGEKGEMQILTDRLGYQLPDGERKYKPAKDGLNVYLTIDRTIQGYVEQALEQAEQEFKPKAMTVVVSDPNTGEILAMGNRSQFNPNEYYKGISNYTNHAVTSMFEPGSTFKIITLAASIEEGLFNPNETYQSGTYTKIPGPAIRDHNNGVGWGRITFLKGVQRSSNVAFVILGYDRLKQDRLKKYFKDFGMGQLTGIELPYEKAGNLNNLDNPRSPRDIAVTTFGQGVTVTAIQQVMAVGAIANGGELLKPHIVKEMRDPNTGEVVKRNEREVVRRVVKESTAKQVRDILETVVTDEEGTGKAYRIDGYHVAGKTGTAQKYNPENGEVMKGHYIVSFIGFAPKDNPRLLVYVVVDDPQVGESYQTWGRKVVAPIFTSVMGRSLQYLQLKPDMQQVQQASYKANTATSQKPVMTDKEVTVPKLVGMSTTTAQLRAQQEQLNVNVVGTGTKIVSQIPAANETVPSGTRVILVTDRVKGAKMPDFTGRSLRDVMEFASLLNIQVAQVGTGFVTQQSIKPGTVLNGGEKLQVTLQPASKLPQASDETNPTTGGAPPGATSGSETTAQGSAEAGTAGSANQPPSTP
ncbi:MULTISPECIES: PASTA domain-containing penicillin-binding protein [Brevibacillus]|jgi:penicillin-binding protein 2B|uniref:PASTA domain-containing penicillin-binding protein n=1 Tax=Brevibacillus aydinogluensis TaxID=927786 RepID=A0AA48RGU9_9BACL|nr:MULTISPECIES: PASTA domain-containing penicillin-binding protein [Brevibacillus]MBR8658111.1 PASTA domain-containing protein [Brevibacillus sp. NL20B1]CAJ1001966.1 PASTA domain-containing penicillin-binding protein [Brevibacillus aydinogluensis]